MGRFRGFQLQKGTKLPVRCGERCAQGFNVCRCCALEKGKVHLLHCVRGTVFIEFGCSELECRFTMNGVKESLTERGRTKGFLQVSVDRRGGENHRAFFGHPSDSPLLKVSIWLIQWLQEGFHCLPVVATYIARFNPSPQTNLRDIGFEDVFLDQVLSVRQSDE